MLNQYTNEYEKFQDCLRIPTEQNNQETSDQANDHEEIKYKLKSKDLIIVGSPKTEMNNKINNAKYPIKMIDEAPRRITISSKNIASNFDTPTKSTLYENLMRKYKNKKIIFSEGY